MVDMDSFFSRVRNLFEKAEEKLVDLAEEYGPAVEEKLDLYWKFTKKRTVFLRNKVFLHYPKEVKLFVEDLAANEKYNWYFKQLVPFVAWYGATLNFVAHMFFGFPISWKYVAAFGLAYYYVKQEGLEILAKIGSVFR